jgi:Caspase domain
MKRLGLSAAALALGVLCAGAGAQPALADKRVALVIGNSAYQHAPVLPNPERDAKAIAAMFEKGGFVVVTAQYDAGNLQFKRTIRQFEDAAADADIAVVYYAGHGIEIHGVNYLIPVDAKLASDRDADDEAITLDRLVEAADGAKRLRLVILDACRDNPFARTMKRQRTAALRGVNAGLGKVEPTGMNTLIAFAAKGGSPAEDGDGDHSPFTTALLDNLFVPGLDVRLAFGRARDEVLKKTANRQEPYVYGSLGGASISIVPAPEQDATPVAAVSDGEKGDYALVEKIGTKGAWEVFLAQHPKGFYADLARQQITKLAMAESGSGTIVRGPPGQQVAAVEPPKLPKPSGPSSDEQREWDKIKNSSNADLFREFIRRYPASPLANTAQSHIDAIEAAARERERLAAEREQKARLEAERKAEAKRKAEQEAALKRAEEEAKAAEEARATAEREAARKREEEERQRELAEAARAKQAAEAEAKRSKAEQAEREAAFKRAQEAAKAAEAARAKAERDAALKREEEERQRKAAEAEQARQEACRRDEERFSALQAMGAKGAGELKEFEQQLTCTRLRPLVLAALKRALAEQDVAGSERVRAAQQELARIGCFGGVIDGSLGESTKAALERYLAQQRRPSNQPEVTDALLSELKSQPTRICPLACPPGQVGEGEECVAEKKSPPVARDKGDEDEPSARRHTKRHEERPSRERRRAERERPAPRESRRAERERPAPRHEARPSRPRPQVRQEASRRPSGGGGGGRGPIIGVGF